MTTPRGAERRLAPEGFGARRKSTSAQAGAIVRALFMPGPAPHGDCTGRGRADFHSLGVVRPRVPKGSLVLVFLASVPLQLGLFATGAGAQPTTTTTAPPTTTTTAPPTTTTTTAPPTTTTSAPVTTTTHHTTTSTTHPTTTTTTAKSSSSTSPWGWVLLGVVILLAILLVLLLISRTRRQGRLTDWRRLVTPAITAAELARDLVQSQTPTDDAERRASVNVQVDSAVTSLERAAASAPDERLAGMCTRCAESLRGLAFAVEADHLMRSGGEHPSGAQLASADAARRSRAAELETALGELRTALADAK